MRLIVWMAPLLAAGALGVGCSDDPRTPGTQGPQDAVVAVADATTGEPDATEAETDAGETDAGEPVDSGATDAGMAMACMPTPPPCQDESIQELNLFRAPNNATITNTATTGGTLSQIDATGGVPPGGTVPTRSFVYMKFGAAGLERVNIGDEAAFDSTDWDIAMRRYVVRLNSGVSGPSCVVARRAAPNLAFDEIDTVPAGDPRIEEYMTPAPACALVNDGSGLPGSPGVAMQSFWEYPGCVKMTGNVYVVTLADGRSLKLQVLSYYSLANQRLCDTESRINLPSGAGAMRIKWAFLP